MYFCPWCSYYLLLIARIRKVSKNTEVFAAFPLLNPA